jgi:hypothetical protein
MNKRLNNLIFLNGMKIKSSVSVSHSSHETQEGNIIEGNIIEGNKEGTFVMFLMGRQCHKEERNTLLIYLYSLWIRP